MNYTVYNFQTGQITKTFTSVDPELVQINLADEYYIKGLYDFSKYYIENNQPILMLPNPSTDKIIYNFNWQTKQWDLNLDLTTQNIRFYRNNLLSTIDRVNPVWYASLTVQQQQELITYRQALLDVPQQSGFPTDISWPAKPTWL